MSCCCLSIRKLCKVGTCTNDLVDVLDTAKSDGIHKLVLEFLESQLVIEKEFITGDPLKFPTDDLNEQYTFLGKVIDPLGAQMTLVIEGIEYDCIEFETIISNVL